MPLERETDWFEKHRDELVRTYLGKFVLVKDEGVRGSFDTAQAAYEAGITTFGSDGFLVKQVLPQDPVEHMPAVWVGTLRAAT